MAKLSMLWLLVALQISLGQNGNVFAETVASPSVEPSLMVLLRRRSHLPLSDGTTAELPTDRKLPSVSPDTVAQASSIDTDVLRSKISPTRTRQNVLVEDNMEDGTKDRVKRCLTCGMDNPNANSMNMGSDISDSERMLLIAKVMGASGDNSGMSGSNGQMFIRQAGNQDGYLQLGPGTYTIAGAMRTTLVDNNMYTLSSYTRLLNGMPTLGVVTLVPMQTAFAGGSRMGSVNANNMNAFGVPNQGTYTIAGGINTFYSEGIPYTASTYTRFADGAATYGTVTLAGLQTYYNDQLLQPGQNAFGVPNQGTFSLAGRMMTSYISGNPVVMSTYTRIVDGVATYGTITLGSMQTFYQGRLLAPGENAFGVPNQGTFTLGGPIQTSLYNGYQMTLSTYTRVIDGLPTYGTVTLGTMQTYFQGKLLQPGENAYGVPNVGTYTLQGAMSTLADTNGYPVTVSTYTKIVNGQATFGTITLGSMQTYYQGRLLKAGENAYGVPNVGVYTLGGNMQTLNMNGYPYTVSSYTKIMDGVATFGTVTLGGMQTYYNGRILAPGENAYGVPSRGTYTLPGSMAIFQTNGYPMTVSTYTKILDGVATFGTITLGSMQTYYNGKLLRQGENAYGVPNQGVYTLPGPMQTLIDQNGYPTTVSSYTKIVDGRATFGAVTQGQQMTYYNGNIVPYGQNPYGVPNQGTYTLPGNMRVLNVAGQQQTQSTYTRIVDGVATYGTITIGQMQTYFVPNDQNRIISNQVQPMIISSPQNQFSSNQMISNQRVNVQPMILSSNQNQLISSSNQGVQPMILLPNSGMSQSGNRQVQIVVQDQNPQPFIVRNNNQGMNSGQFRTEILTQLTNIPVTRTRIVPVDDGQFQAQTVFVQQGQSIPFPNFQRVTGLGGPMPCGK